MNDMTYEDIRAAAEMLRRYARGVETHLYISMKTDQAHKEICEAYRLADDLEEVAAKLDTAPPDEAA